MNEIVIKKVKDFNTEHIFECGQCFRWNSVPDSDAYVGVVNGYVCKAECRRAELNDRNADCKEGVDLYLEVTGGDETFWRRYFDMETDYSEIKRCVVSGGAAEKDGSYTNSDCDNRSAEDKMRSAVEYGYGIRILNQDLFETIISFIISQNNNIPRIKKCIESICSHYGESLGFVFGAERFSFPSAEVLAEVPVCELAELKLGYRCSYIVEAARKFIAEGEPHSYEDVISYLGIGPKVANCIMLFGLHKVDAFPVDTWVKHIMNDMYGFAESDVRGMTEFAEDRFGSYAGYAQQYLFYYYRDRK